MAMAIQHVSRCTTTWQLSIGPAKCPARYTTAKRPPGVPALQRGSIIPGNLAPQRTQRHSLGLRWTANAAKGLFAACPPETRAEEIEILLGLRPSHCLFGPAFVSGVGKKGVLLDKQAMFFQEAEWGPPLEDSDSPYRVKVISRMSGWRESMPHSAHFDYLAEDSTRLEASFQNPRAFPSNSPPIAAAESKPPPHKDAIQRIQEMLKGLARVLGAVVLASAVALCTPYPALGARSMGRAGGGSFSSSRSSSSHSSSGGHSGSSSRSTYSSSSWSSYSSSFRPSYRSSSRRSSSGGSSWWGGGGSSSEFSDSRPRRHSSRRGSSGGDGLTEDLRGGGSEQGMGQHAEDTRKNPMEWVIWLIEFVYTCWLACLHLLVVLYVLMSAFFFMTEREPSRSTFAGTQWREDDEILMRERLKKYSGADVSKGPVPKKAQAREAGANAENTITVVEIQVALLGQAKSVQVQMDKLCEEADTSTKVGLYHLLLETLLVILHHSAFWAYGNAQTYPMGSDGAEKRFQQITLEERSKAEHETLVNKSGTLTKMPSVRNLEQEPSPNEITVVTVLAAVKGRLEERGEAKNLTARESVKSSVQALGRVQADRLEVLEILWVPQEDDDTLTHAELVEKFNDLSPL